MISTEPAARIREMAQMALRDPDLIRALGEDSHARPALVPARVTGTRLDVRGVDAVEHVDDLDVAELLEAVERFWPEALVEPHDRLDAVPVVVDGLAAPADDGRDRLETQRGGHGRMMTNECE